MENSYSTYRDMYLHANKYFCNKKINIFFNLKTLNQPIKEEKKNLQVLDDHWHALNRE